MRWFICPQSTVRRNNINGTRARLCSRGREISAVELHTYRIMICIFLQIHRDVESFARWGRNLKGKRWHAPDARQHNNYSNTFEYNDWTTDRARTMPCRLVPRHLQRQTIQRFVIFLSWFRRQLLPSRPFPSVPAMWMPLWPKPSARETNFVYPQRGRWSAAWA